MALPGPTTPPSPPGRYIARMVVFIALIGVVAALLRGQILEAFLANPALNAVIVAAMAIGILLALHQVARLYRETRWARAVHLGDAAKIDRARPKLLAPLAAAGFPGAPAGMTRVLIDSLGMRLDEGRETVRYLAGLLVFLGLLGTFWGLIETVGSIGKVISSMRTGGEGGALFEELKAGLAAPLAGMGVSFSASLFGLAGSLVLGFLDLQVGQAHNRFYAEVEDWVGPGVAAPAGTMDASAPLVAAIADLKAAMEADPQGSRAATQAMASLADGIQSLVRHMRSEQQMIRDWVEAQASRERRLERIIERLAPETADHR